MRNTHTDIHTHTPVALDDDDAPELTPALRRELRPAAELLPPEVLAAFKRTPGRPKKADAKAPVSLRLSPDVLAHYKALGAGWQAKVEEVLRAAMTVSKL